MIWSNELPIENGEYLVITFLECDCCIDYINVLTVYSEDTILDSYKHHTYIKDGILKKILANTGELIPQDQLNRAYFCKMEYPSILY